VDWSPSYYILAVIAAGAVVIALVMGAAKLRLRPLSFAMIGLAVVAGVSIGLQLGPHIGIQKGPPRAAF
jgi:hypothetical protein